MKSKLPFVAIGAVWALTIAAVILGKSPAEAAFTASPDAVILIIRHAEETGSGNQLSPAGAARAQALVGYFQEFKVDGQPLKLDSLFAARNSAKSHRPFLTIEPLAKALDLTIDARFDDDQVPELIHELETRPPGKNILISWRHGEIPALLSALGADPQKLLPKGKWPGKEYDWLIQLRYDANGRLFESQRIQQNLTPADPGQPAATTPR